MQATVVACNSNGFDQEKVMGMNFKSFMVRVGVVFGFVTMSLVADVTVMTEDSPPLNYTNEKGELTGFSTEIVLEIQKRLGYKNPPEEMPWSRGYALLQSKANYVLYSTTRNETREKLFKWVGPLIPTKTVLWGRADRDYNITSVDDARKYKVGTYRNDASEIRIKKLGGFKIESVIKDDRNLNKLLAGEKGKIDLWGSGSLSGAAKAKKAGVSDKIKIVFSFPASEVYIAFNKETPDSEVKKWQDTLDALKKDGFYQKTREKYFGK
jgi:polar amino acid transport system substrate-binding protein